MKNVSIKISLGALAVIAASSAVWGFYLSREVVRLDALADNKTVSSEAYTTYTSAELGLSIMYPTTVHLLSSDDSQLTFSLLSPEDIKQRSSVGLMSAFTFSKNSSAPNEKTLSADENESGIRKLIVEKVGAYGGELHRTYYFIDHGITAHYVVSSSTEAVFEQMLRTIHFLSMPHVVLVDGEEIWGGVFQDAPVIAGSKFFTSNEIGLSFSYPEDNLLFVYNKLLPNQYSISIEPKEETLSTIQRARSGYGGEWPPSVGISFFPLLDQSVSLESWIRTDLRSNFDPALSSDEQQKNILVPTIVDGVPALTYHNEGLYSVDYVAFNHGQWVVVVAGASSSATPNKNLKPIIETLRLSKVL